MTFESLCNDVLSGMSDPHPACNSSQDCRRAGGCWYCQVMSPFKGGDERCLWEWRRDREMDAEMRERARRDPEFAAMQKAALAEFLEGK
jgi:hypothetical protein